MTSNYEQSELKRFELFFKNKERDLEQLYISERLRNNKELGALILFMNKDNIDVKYFPISSSELTPEIKQDIISKNNHRNSRAFMILVHHSLNISKLIIKDLESN